ncbi:MAG: NmrA family protein [Microbacteriaceae bacterium]|nr:NmrA family protein [Microbacteriaceae bacterium]
MTIVVTGATGQLGRLAIESLLARGVAASDILAAGRSAEKLAPLADLGVGTARIDFTEPASLEAAFAGADAVLLVSASEPGQRVAQHANAIDAAKAAGVGHVVYTSAPRADTTELVLAPEHKATEELLVASGLPVTILRNNWYTENYAGTFAQARETGRVVGNTGEGRVASATRADYADAAAVVLTTDGHVGATYELGGDTAWNFHELAAVFAEVLGRDVVYTPVSAEEHRAQLLAAGLDEGTAAFVVALDANIAAGTLAEVTGDLSRLIGRPTTPLIDAVRAFA